MASEGFFRKMIVSKEVQAAAVAAAITTGVIHETKQPATTEPKVATLEGMGSAPYAPVVRNADGAPVSIHLGIHNPPAPEKINLSKESDAPDHRDADLPDFTHPAHAEALHSAAGEIHHLHPTPGEAQIPHETPEPMAQIVPT